MAKSLTNLERSAKHSASWELAVLKPELSNLKLQLDVLRDDNRRLKSQLTSAQGREREVQDMIQRAKSRNGRLLLEVEDMRQRLEDQGNVQDVANSLQHQLSNARDRATDAEMECESLRGQLARSGRGLSDAADAADSADELAERLMEMQEALDAARDRATDAELENESLRKQLKHGRIVGEPTEGDSEDDPHLFEKLAALQEQLDTARDRATDAEMECESLRGQLAKFGRGHSDAADAAGSADELAERLVEMQEALDAARDRATDAELENESLRKQLKHGIIESEPTEGDSEDDPHLFEKLAALQEQLDTARDRATDAEMECESLRGQLAKFGRGHSDAADAAGSADELAERLVEMQEALDAARDRATDAELENESLRKQLKHGRIVGEPTEGDSEDDPHLFEKLAALQEQLDTARDRATDAEMECESLRGQLAKFGRGHSDAADAAGSADELAERLVEMQEALDAARDRATDAELENESLRKQLKHGRIVGEPTEGDSEDDPHLFEKLAALQEQLDTARDRATDAEMECESLRGQLAKFGRGHSDAADTAGSADELAERLVEMQEALDAARDRATDAELENESLRKQLHDVAVELHDGKTRRELELEGQIMDLMTDLHTRKPAQL